MIESSHWELSFTALGVEESEVVDRALLSPLANTNYAHLESLHWLIDNRISIKYYRISKIQLKSTHRKRFQILIQILIFLH